MERHDYAFPFAIDPGSRQAARAHYPAHVAQMIRQVLLTAPGERANLPEFGCGLRQLIFAPHSEALDATTRLIVQEALERWLAGQIIVREITVLTPEETGDEAQLAIRIEYELVETRTPDSVQVTVR